MSARKIWIYVLIDFFLCFSNLDLPQSQDFVISNFHKFLKKSKIQICSVNKKSFFSPETSSHYLILLINKRHGNWTLEQTIWLWNPTSHTKFYFNEFVANVFRDNMGMIISDLPRLWQLLEAKNIISWCTLWHFNSTFGSSHSASSAY